MFDALPQWTKQNEELILHKLNGCKNSKAVFLGWIGTGWNS